MKLMIPFIALSLAALTACKTAAPAGEAVHKRDIAVSDFTSCYIKTGEVMESYPRQCAYDGEAYVEDITPSKKGTKTKLYFKVAGNTQTCMSMIEQQCLVVNGEYFYDGIEGYTHIEGQERILEVERTQYCDPATFKDCPQDVGIYQYRLLKVVK